MKRKIRDLYQLIVDNNLTDKTFRQFEDAIQNDEYKAKIYEVLVSRQIFEGEPEEFTKLYFPELKKKDPAELTSRDQRDASDSVSELDQQNTLSVSLPDVPEAPQSTVGQDAPRFQSDEQIRIARANQEEISRRQEESRKVGQRYGVYKRAQKEKDTWLEEMLGKNFATDFFGDMWRAAMQGRGQGASIDEALQLYASGSTISDEDLKEYIQAVEQMDSYGMSDEMKSFNEIYENNGGGILGFVLGVGANPSVIGQLFVSSIASYVNPTVAAGAGVGAGAGALAGGGAAAAAGSIGGPIGTAVGALGGTGGGAIFGALAGAGATLETGLSFTEFLKEEVQKKGLEFNADGIREVLEDEDALQSIRNRSASRGIAIGVIDVITRGVASKVGGKGIRAAKKAKQQVTKGMKARAATTAAGIEAVGGGTGEVAGRAVAGQEMDVAEIGFETITGQTSSVLSVPQAVTGKTVTELLGVELPGANVFMPPVYGILDKKGKLTKMSKLELEKFIDTATPDQIRTIQFKIKNDPALLKVVQNKQIKAQVDADIPAYIVGEDRIRMIELETELRTMPDTDLSVNKKRIKKINSELDAITDKYADFTVTDQEAKASLEEQNAFNREAEKQGQPFGPQIRLSEQNIQERKAQMLREKVLANQNTAEVTKLAVDQLAAEGITDPTEQQINDKINAIQKSSTEEVDVQESTRDRPQVGTRDTEGDIAEESQAQDQTPIETQTEEEISVNVAPFFETSIESTTEAKGLRKSPEYQKYKESLIEIANDLGLDVEVDESVGGYVNNAGTKVREVSNVVRLKNATIDQASQYAALTAALAPEVQESSIAAEYTVDGAENHNGNELTIKVSDSEGTFQSLQEAGIDDFTLNESNNTLTLLDIFDFSDPEADAKLERLVDILDNKKISYEITDKKAINSRFIGSESRQQILSDGRQSAIQQQQEGTGLYQKIISAINRDAQNLGITPNEYIQVNVTEQPVTADPQRVQTIIDDIIKKTRGRKVGESTNPQVVLDNTLNYLQNSKLYQQLDDVARNTLVRQLNEQLGINIKKPPSVKKILGKQKDKKIVVNERVALKDQIKAQAKAAKAGVKAFRTFLKNVSAQVKTLQKSGKITQKQTAAITGRLASINPFNKKSVDNFLNYVDTVFTKADYVEKISKAKKLAKRAKRNLGLKTGGLKGDLKTSLQTVFSFNPYSIPVEQFDNYFSLLEQFTKTVKGTRELSLQDQSTTRQQALDILNAIQADNDAQVEIEVEKETKADDYNVDTNAKEAKGIEISTEQIKNIVGKDFQDVARFIKNLTLNDIKDLGKTGIESLKAIKKNIQNGSVSPSAIKLKRTVMQNRSAKITSDVIKKKATKANILRNIRNSIKAIKAYYRGTTTILERMRGGPLFNIDDIVGNFNSKTIYRQTVGKLQKAYEAYRQQTNKQFIEIDKADKALEFDGVKKPRRWFSMGRSRNAIVKAKAKIAAFQLQREYLSNFIDGKPNPKAPSAIDFLKATIKKLKAADRTNQNQIDILQEIADEFSVDGQINLEKIEKSFTKAEKAYLAIMDKINGQQAEKALFISSAHGNQIDLYNNYVHHATIGESKKQVSELQQMADKYNKSVLGETKAGTIEARENNARAISFDPSYSAKRGLQATNMDYYMTETLKEVSGFLNKMETDFTNDESSTPTQIQVVKALNKAVSEVNRNVFLNSFNDVGVVGKFLTSVQRLGYQAALASIYRGGAEFIGNLNMFMRNPIKGTKALKNFGKLTLMDPATVYNAAVNLKSGVVTKLVDSDVLKGKYGNMTDFGMPVRATGEAVTTFENILGMIKRFSGLPQYASAVNQIANKVLSFPDQVLARPMWFQSYAQEFENQTGIKLTSKDFQAIAKGESKYLGAEFEAARKAAVDAADNAVVVQSTSTNPYDGVLKNMISPEDSGGMKYLKMLNGFLARYQLFEFGNANHAFFALFNKGELSKAEAGAMLGGTIMRMGTYMVAYTALTRILDDELFSVQDKQKEEDDYEDLLARQMIGSILTLIFAGNTGNLGRIPINLALEYGINEPLMGDFRDGEYNPYVHSMVFSQLSMEDIQKGDIFEAGLKIGLAAYGPLLNSLRRAGVVTSRAFTSEKRTTKQKYKEELETRILIEALGNTGLLPFYKDIRRIILKDMFGDRPTPEQQRRIKKYKENNPELFKERERPETSSRRNTERPERSSSRRENTRRKRTR